MASLDAGRRTEEAISWAADLIGGKIVRRERQARWRPAYFLDIEKPDGSIKKVLLRGFRSPIGADEEAFRARLRMEAGICKALGEAGCKVPGYHGYHAEGGWFLMDVLDGTPYLTHVDDPARQARLFRKYIEAIVEMHKLDYRKMDLPDNLPISKSYEDGIGLMLKEFRAPYDNFPDKNPEPVIELALWWLDNHRPKPVDRFSITTGDIGTDQFMFEGETFHGMFDLEMGYVGDPMQDIGMTRLRDMGYTLPGLPDHLRYWSELMGRELDRESLCYWTVAGMIASPLYVYPLWAKPSAFVGVHKDLTFVHVYIPVHMRGTCEALAEYYGFELTPPEKPEPHVSSFTEYGSWLVAQMKEYYPPQTDDTSLSFDYQCSAALAETALLCQTLGPILERQNIDDLETLLDQIFATERDGLAALQLRIQADPEKDIEATIRTLHRIQCRKEFVLAPMQKFGGFNSGSPMQRVF